MPHRQLTEPRPTGGEFPVTDPHQPATSPGTDQGDIDRRAALAEALGKEVWPADRDTLVTKAREGNASDAVLGQLSWDGSPEYPYIYGHFASGGSDIRIASTLPPVFSPNSVPRSCSRLNST